MQSDPVWQMLLLLLVQFTPCSFSHHCKPFYTFSYTCICTYVCMYVCVYVCMYILFCITVFSLPGKGSESQSLYFASLDCCTLWLQHWTSGHKLRNSMGPLKNTYILVESCVLIRVHTYIHTQTHIYV